MGTSGEKMMIKVVTDALEGETICHLAHNCHKLIYPKPTKMKKAPPTQIELLEMGEDSDGFFDKEYDSTHHSVQSTYTKDVKWIEKCMYNFLGAMESYSFPHPHLTYSNMAIPWCPCSFVQLTSTTIPEWHKTVRLQNYFTVCGDVEKISQIVIKKSDSNDKKRATYADAVRNGK
eukprot:CAMPEP_0195538580 /NCGR_PEP_ID=MMETSP0794_2-20130614/49605_1 /TAXON_ID=515487 /ORGANISM="Stephanopyxis turris, Strain CCMP 815" /LENGTH=174 /DNA_ID=CAMNT_0040672575 /DNA_START=1403 /DNA_END=1927 /DNA_ORIENTATION=+